MKRLNELDQLKQLTESLSDINEAPTVMVSPEQYLRNVGEKHMDQIGNLEFVARQLRKSGNPASAKSIDNMIGAMEQSIDSLDAAKADLGK